MSQIKFCPQCGSSLDAGTRFCPQCGTSIVRTDDVAAAGAASAAATANAAINSEADAAAAMASLGIDDAATVVIPPLSEDAQWQGGAHVANDAAARQRQQFQSQPTQQIPTQNAYGAPGSQGYQQGGYQQGTYQQSGYQQGGYQQGGYQQGGYQQGGYQQGGYQQGGYQAQSTAAYTPPMTVVDSPRQNTGTGKRVVALICAVLAIVFLNLPWLSIPDMSTLLGSSGLEELSYYGITIKSAYSIPDCASILNTVANVGSSYASASAMGVVNALHIATTVLVVVWVANMVLLAIGALKLFAGKLRRGTFLVVAGVLNILGAIAWCGLVFAINAAIVSEVGYNISLVSITPWVIVTIVACLLAVIFGAMCKRRV